MKNSIIILLLICFMTACKSEKRKHKAQSTFSHEIVAKEIIQVSGYTYVRSLEHEKEIWVAVPSFKGKVGETYYFNDGLEMFDFKSKELKRTFKSIYFLQEIHTNPNLVETTLKKESSYVPVVKEKTSSSKHQGEKQDLKIAAAEGVTSIASLYENLTSLAGKKVRVKGKVTKFSAMIMNKNWIHIQDGTDFNGAYDLIITSLLELAVGDVVELEGIVAKDIDLGYGYKYKLLLEKAELVKN